MNFDFWRHSLRARLFDLLRQPERALSERQAALKHNPRSAPLHHAVAFQLAQQRRFVDAEHHLREAARLAPHNANLWFNLGYIYDQHGEPLKAIEAFREAVRLDQKLDRAWYGLGQCHVRVGNHREAVHAFEQAAALLPMNGAIWYALGMAHHALDDAEKVTRVVEQLNRYERKYARQLINDTGRTDLQHLIADLHA